MQQIEINCLINVMSLNHSQTMSSTPHPYSSPWNYLPWNQSLVPKRSGTSDLQLRGMSSEFKFHLVRDPFVDWITCKLFNFKKLKFLHRLVWRINHLLRGHTHSLEHSNCWSMVLQRKVHTLLVILEFSSYKYSDSYWFRHKNNLIFRKFT